MPQCQPSASLLCREMEAACFFGRILTASLEAWRSCRQGHSSSQPPGICQRGEIWGVRLFQMLPFTGERHLGMCYYFWPGQAVSEMAFESKERDMVSTLHNWLDEVWCAGMSKECEQESRTTSRAILLPLPFREEYFLIRYQHGYECGCCCLLTKLAEVKSGNVSQESQRYWGDKSAVLSPFDKQSIANQGNSVIFTAEVYKETSAALDRAQMF